MAWAEPCSEPQCLHCHSASKQLHPGSPPSTPVHPDHLLPVTHASVTWTASHAERVQFDHLKQNQHCFDQACCKKQYLCQHKCRFMSCLHAGLALLVQEGSLWASCWYLCLLLHDAHAEERGYDLFLSFLLCTKSAATKLSRTLGL